MDHLEFHAKTADEAIEQALGELGLDRDQVNITVIHEGRIGILGIGSEDALVRVEPRLAEPENRQNITEIARGVLEVLLQHMEMTASVTVEEQSVTGAAGTTIPITFNVTGDDLGILIGRHGKTLASLQFLVRLIVAHQAKSWSPIVIDIEGYKQRRYQALQQLAQRIAVQVKTRGRPFTLEPMPAFERRIVHLSLANHPDVTTSSTGEGDGRKVIIAPKRSRPFR